MDFSKVDLPYKELEDLFCAKLPVKLIKPEKEEKPKAIILLPPKRQNNVSIFLNTFKKSHLDIHRAILKLDESVLSAEPVMRLIECVPGDEEVATLDEYVNKGGNVDLLGDAERFLILLKTIPDLLLRLNCFLYKLSFGERFNDSQPKLIKVRQAIKEVKNSKKILQFAEIVLAVGNFMNGQKAGALGFKIETLNKLIDTKTVDNQKTLLHYLVGLVETKYPEAINLHKDLPTVEAAAKVSFTGVTADITELKSGHSKFTEVITSVKPAPKNDNFQSVMPSAFHDFKSILEDLWKELEATTAEYAQMEESFRGQSDTTPEEFFTQLNKFLENLTRVRQDIELERVKREREEQKEKKIQNSLIAEIHKGVSLKKAPEKETKQDVKEEEKIKKLASSSRMAEMGNIAAQIAKSNAEREKKKKTQQLTKQVPVIKESKLDKLLADFEN